MRHDDAVYLGHMLDTAIKDGLGLFDALCEDEIAGFLAAGHAAGLEVAFQDHLSKAHDRSNDMRIRCAQTTTSYCLKSLL